jgi:hypothetical protein
VDYELTDTGKAFLDSFGVILPGRRRPVRYCVDWSEQRHHLAGVLGRGLLDRFLELRWIECSADSRAVRVTDAGRQGFQETFTITL